MKKNKFIFAAAFLFSFCTQAFAEKITELPEATSASPNDLFVMVEDPEGTPVTKKITGSNLQSIVGSGGAALSVVYANGYPDSDILTSQGISFMSHDDVDYLAFYDSTNHLALGKRPSFERGDWEIVVYDGTGGRPNITVPSAIDLHNSPALGVDSDGNVHVAYNMHDASLLYRKTSTPGDISTLGSVISMLGTNESSVTYPIFIKDRATPHDLYFNFRNGQSGLGNGYLYKFNTTSDTWAAAPGTSTAGHVWRGTADSNSAYVSHPYVDPSNNFHWTFGWRDSDDHDLAYVGYDGAAFTKADGSSQTVPIRTNNDEVIDSAAFSTDGFEVTQGRRNITVTSDGTIHIAYSKFGPNHDYGQIWYVQHPSGGAWSTPVQLTSTADVFTDTTDPTQKTTIILSDDSDNLYIIFKASSLGGGIMVLKSTTGGASWNQFSIFSGSLGYWKPQNINFGYWDNHDTLALLLQLTYQRDVIQTRSPVYLLEWKPSYGGFASQIPSAGFWSYYDQNFASYAGTLRFAGDINFENQNRRFVESDADISTIYSAGTSGDHNFLGCNATYTTTASLDTNTNKSSITLQGCGTSKTKITTSTANLKVFNIRAGGNVIRDLSIVNSGNGSTTSTNAAIYIDGSGGTVLSGVVIENVDITTSGSDDQACIFIKDANVKIRNSTCNGQSISATTGGNVFGVRLNPGSTMEASTVVDVYNTTMITSNTAASKNSLAYSCSDGGVTGGRTATLNLWGANVGTSTESTGSTTSQAVRSSAGAGCVINVYDGRYSATDQDFAQASSGVLNIYEGVSVNNTTTGTLTHIGKKYIGGLATSVASATDQACNTTCTTSCLAGWDSASSAPLGCSNANADNCLCTA